MKYDTVLIENDDIGCKKGLMDGLAFQLEFDGKNYVFITGSHSTTYGFIENLVDVPIYGKDMPDTLPEKYEKAVIINSALRHGNPIEPMYMTGHNFFHKNELKDIFKVDMGSLTMHALEKELKKELGKYKTGKQKFTDRLVPKWKSGTKVGYRSVNIPIIAEPKNIPACIKGSCMYRIEDDGILLKNEKPRDHEIIETIFGTGLPGLDYDFSTYAGSMRIKHR